MANLFSQFVAFGTDIVGLERFLRGIQSLLQIITAWPFLLSYISPEITFEKIALFKVALSLLQSRVAISRRVIRTFRFLDSFNAGWLLFQRKSTGQGLEVWLDVLSLTTLGMYGMLETITMLDVFEIPGLEYFGPLKTREYNRQAMTYWFVALFTSALSGLIKMKKASGGGSTGAKASKGKKNSTKGRKSISEKGTGAINGAQSTAKVRQIAIDFVADCMDLVLPAVALGWVKIDPGIVGSMMLVTTFLTGRKAWFRCGREVDAKAV